MSYLVKSEKEGEILYGIPNMWNLKGNDFNELTFKIETDFETMVAQEERWEEGIVRKFGMSVYTLLHLK